MGEESNHQTASGEGIPDLVEKKDEDQDQAAHLRLTDDQILQSQKHSIKMPTFSRLNRSSNAIGKIGRHSKHAAKKSFNAQGSLPQIQTSGSPSNRGKSQRSCQGLLREHSHTTQSQIIQKSKNKAKFGDLTSFSLVEMILKKASASKDRGCKSSSVGDGAPAAASKSGPSVR